MVQSSLPTPVSSPSTRGLRANVDVCLPRNAVERSVVSRSRILGLHVTNQGCALVICRLEVREQGWSLKLEQAKEGCRHHPHL
jgi:hypothetical protein